MQDLISSFFRNWFPRYAAVFEEESPYLLDKSVRRYFITNDFSTAEGEETDKVFNNNVIERLYIFRNDYTFERNFIRASFALREALVRFLK